MPDSSLQQFVIIAYDGTDADALQRRLLVREKHLETVRKLEAEGSFIKGGAILDDQGKMIGSVAMVAFPSRAELDAWLNNDPYVTGNVWQNIEVKPFRCVIL